MCAPRTVVGRGRWPRIRAQPTSFNAWADGHPQRAGGRRSQRSHRSPQPWMAGHHRLSPRRGPHIAHSAHNPGALTPLTLLTGQCEGCEDHAYCEHRRWCEDCERCEDPMQPMCGRLPALRRPGARPGQALRPSAGSPQLPQCVTGITEAAFRLPYSGHQRDGAGSRHQRRPPGEGEGRWAC
jgi:hypothetical protein